MAGALLTSFLTSSIGLQWEYTYLIIGQMCFVIALVNLLALVVHPEEKGIRILEIDDKMNQHEEMLRRHTHQMNHSDDADT